MKIYLSILIISLISITKSAGVTALIETAVSKESVAKNDEFTIKLTNGEDTPISADTAVNGLSLVSGKNTIALTCENVASEVAKDASTTVKCKANAAQTEKGDYTLTADATTGKVGSVAITVADTSKKVTITGSTGGNNNSNSNNNNNDPDEDNSQYQKISYILFLFGFLF